MRERSSSKKQSSSSSLGSSSAENKASSAVSPSSFYGTDSGSTSQKTPPPHPKRKSTAGSSHSKYFAPQTTSSQTSFREPELVDDSTHQASQSLMPENVASTAEWPADTNTNTNTNSGWPDDTQTWSLDNYQDQNSGWNIPQDEWSTGAWSTHAGVPIDGRNENEENVWWDRNDGIPLRPGPGRIPPRLVEEIHNNDHTLFAVSVSSPDIRLPAGGSSPSGEYTTCPLIRQTELTSILQLPLLYHLLPRRFMKQFHIPMPTIVESTTDGSCLFGSRPPCYLNWLDPLISRSIYSRCKKDDVRVQLASLKTYTNTHRIGRTTFTCIVTLLMLDSSHLASPVNPGKGTHGRKSLGGG